MAHNTVLIGFLVGFLSILVAYFALSLLEAWLQVRKAPREDTAFFPPPCTHGLMRKRDCLEIVPGVLGCPRCWWEKVNAANRSK